jgi:uncharacterized protein
MGDNGEVIIFHFPFTLDFMSHLSYYFKRLFLPIALAIFALQIFTLPAQATAVYEVPSVSAGVPTWLVDKAEEISLTTKGKVKGTLEKLAQETGNEVRFVTIHRLDYGDTIQTFTDKLFQKWFPTEEEQTKQTLIVLDNLTNTVGIATGAGVKSLLTDEIATSIVKDTMGMPLRDGNKYNQAFADATDRLYAVLSGQEDPGPPEVKATPEVGRTFLKAEETDANRGSFTIIVVGLLIAATIIPMATWWWYQSQD